MKKLLQSLTLVICLTGVFQANAGTGISAARTAGAGSTVTVRGIVTVTNELGAITRFIQDSSAGLQIYDSKDTITRAGDSVEVSGKLVDYNNLLELSTVSSLTILSRNNPLPAPINLGFNAVYDEKYEGMLVTITGVTFSATGSFGGNKNYPVKQGTVGPHDVRILSTTDLVGAPIPAKAVDITGILGQYKTTYQLQPRSKQDFSYGNAPGLLTNIIQTRSSQTTLDLKFITKKQGNTVFYYGKTKALELGSVTDTTHTLIHTTFLTALSAATVYYVKAYTVSTAGDSSESGVQLFITESKSSGKITTYFNLSVDTTKARFEKAKQLYHTIDDSLVAYIKRARKTIDFAIYSFDNYNLNPNISQALNDAQKRGVLVRAVSDGNNKNQGILDLNSSIKVVRGPKSGLVYGIMHNKFIVIDANDTDANVPIVWTGSTNWTDNQIYSDADNVIIFQDQSMAKVYTIEFEEMFAGTFGPDKKDNTPHEVKVGGRRVEVFFSPSDGTTQGVINAINSANTDLYFSNFVLTRSDIAAAIKSRYYAGVFCAGILGDTTTSQYSSLYKVLQGRIRYFTGSGLFHHKYYIIDPSNPTSDPQVATGSHNFSTAAETKNDENMVIVHDSTVANVYYQEWINRYKDNGGSIYYTAVEEATPLISKDAAVISYRWAADQMALRFESANTGSAYVRLTDISGKTIYAGKLAVNSGLNTPSIDMPQMASGVYVLSIFLNGENHSFKIARF